MSSSGDPFRPRGEFRLNTSRHFRWAGFWLLMALALGVADWRCDSVAVREQGSTGALSSAIAAGILFGLAEAAFLVASARSVRTYLAVCRGQARALVLSVDAEGVTLHLYGKRLRWNQLLAVRTIQVPRGGKALPLPVARYLPPRRLVLFMVRVLRIRPLKLIVLSQEAMFLGLAGNWVLRTWRDKPPEMASLLP